MKIGSRTADTYERNNGRDFPTNVSKVQRRSEITVLKGLAAQFFIYVLEDLSQGPVGVEWKVRSFVAFDGVGGTVHFTGSFGSAPYYRLRSFYRPRRICTGSKFHHGMIGDDGVFDSSLRNNAVEVKTIYFKFLIIHHLIEVYRCIQGVYAVLRMKPRVGSLAVEVYLP